MMGVDVILANRAVTMLPCMIAPSTTISRLREFWPVLVVASGPVAAVVGLLVHSMWRVLPWERFALSLLMALLATTLAWPLQRFLRMPRATALALVWSLALLFFVGLLPALAVLVLALASLAIGLRLVADTMPARVAVAMVVGLVAIAGVSGWLLTLPLHHAYLWYPVLLIVIFLQCRPLRAALRSARQDWNASIVAAPRWAAFAVMLVGLTSTACWLPTMQVDDLAYHLGLPSQLLAYARYMPDAQHQVWAFAPWAGDTLQGIASVLAGADARGALNALWLVAAAAAAGATVSRLRPEPSAAWASVALFASFPPLVWMAAGMQTELAATAVLFGLAAVIIAGDGKGLLPGALLFAGLLALKPIHALAALPLLAYAGWLHRRQWQWRQLPLASLIVITIAGSSYCFSWLRTGNPVLPLFNGFFASPYFPLENYRDGRWFTGFTPDLIWQLVFDTDRFVEAWDGGLGIGLIALAGAWLLALLRRDLRALAIAATCVLLLPLIPMQYARYAYPCMLLLSITVLPAIRTVLSERGFSWLIAGICVCNLAFQANASWLHHSSALKRVIRNAGDYTEVFTHYVPERVLLKAIPASDRSLVLATEPTRSYIAELGGRGRAVLDHDPFMAADWRHAQADASGTRWRMIFRNSGARWFLIEPKTASSGLRAAMRAARLQRVAQVGDAELWQLPPEEAASP